MGVLSLFLLLNGCVKQMDPDSNPLVNSRVQDIGIMVSESVGAAEVVDSQEDFDSIARATYVPIPAVEIEQRFRQMDSWIEGYLEADYSNGILEGTVHLRYIGEDILNIGTDHNIREALAWYNQQENILAIPEVNTEERKEEVLGALTHELWHGVYDRVYTSGTEEFFFSEKYTGPSREEILEFCRVKADSDEFQELRDTVLVEGEYQVQRDTFLSTQSHLHRSGKIVNSLISDLNNPENRKIFGAVRQLGWLDEDVLSAAYDRLEQERVRYVECLDLEDEIFDWHAKLVEPQEIGGNIVNRFVQYNIEFSECGDLSKEWMSLTNDFWGLYGNHINTSIAREVIIGAPVRSLVAIEISQGNAKAVYNTLYDENEMMARIVDSLYSLYYGPVSPIKYPLHERDIEFLQRFSVEGEAMFGKGVEKYLLGQKMIDDGNSPEQVKLKLEFATSYDYAGQSYSWPEANFTILGQIPHATTNEASGLFGTLDQLDLQ